MQHNLPYVVVPWGGEEGGEYVVWAEHVQTIAQMIEKYNLKVIDPVHLPRGAYRITAEMAMDFPNGGKRGPHLHYAGEAYAVSPEQWRVFTNAVVQNCRDRLDTAQEVPLSLEAVAEIGEMAAGLPI
jgi:hypothetical protein